MEAEKGRRNILIWETLWQEGQQSARGFAGAAPPTIAPAGAGPVAVPIFSGMLVNSGLNVVIKIQFAV